MRRELTREALKELMRELARTAPAGESFRVYLVGGSTAVLAGWRAATIKDLLDAQRFGHPFAALLLVFGETVEQPVPPGRL